MESLQFIIELLGTFAFAISGIRSASSKNFDWFGGYVVGLATAIGGGTIRDVMLGQAPFWMTNSVYMVCTAFALLTFVMLKRQFTRLSKTWFLFDTLGLALFTIAGLQKTLIAGYPFWVAIIMGCMTGAAGGVLRDVLVNEVPLIFRKDIYALACAGGGMVYWLLLLARIGSPLLQIFPAITVIVIRVLAVHFNVCLPSLKSDQ